ncbi:uncharacterized protein LOC109836345 [Asparagus officinalis]|uniref:uncharacterized protein LOC109836345 n=1 Tax=Asparagus officinalis TaxID=4686 RepID=UPI00098E6417|nr:uncharacterized protein LOC109836345 [Asparagus officinalis]
MEGLNDTETFHHATNAPPSNPIQDPSGCGDRLLDDMLLEQTRRDVTEPVIEAVEPIIEIVEPVIEAGSSVGTIIETQSSVAQTQHTILATEMTTAAAGVSPVEQIVGPTEKVDTSTVVAFVAPSPVHEVVQVESSVGNPAEGTSVGLGISLQLSDLVKALLLDDDPNQIVLCTEVSSFFTFVGKMIDKLLHSGTSFRQFRPFLDRKLSLIEKIGSPHLSRAIADDLTRPERDFQKLKEFRDTGAPSYIAAQMESRLKAWRDAQALVEPEVQVRQSKVNKMKAVLDNKLQTLQNIKSSLVSSVGKIAQVKQELQAEEETWELLEMTRVNEERNQEIASRELKLSEQELTKAKEEAARMLSANEESMKATLQEELKQAYVEELSQLKQQVLNHKLRVE